MSKQCDAGARNLNERAPHSAAALKAPSGPYSVVVYGPQACGKTRNAPALARYFGLAHWRDLEPGDHAPARNHLLLTNVDPRELGGIVPGWRRVFSFDTAMKMAGLKK
jgi:DNA polymerase III delta prime subunit